MPATLVLTNGRIYTLDNQQPTATAVAVRDDRVLGVGSDEEMLSLLDNRDDYVNLEGRTVTPGLVDAHIHFQGYALNLSRVDLSTANDLKDTLDLISAGIESTNREGWLLGRGWNQSDWPGQRFPTAVELDAVTGSQPALFHHRSGHAAWANSQALNLAGIGPDTPNPPGGSIQKDNAGNPTGILFEDALKLVTRVVPKPQEEEIVAAMKIAQDRSLSLGLTGFHDFDGRSCFAALQTLRSRGEQKLRVVKNIPVTRLEHAVGIGLQSGFGDSWLRIGSVKMFADGALGPRTAAMLSPYEGAAQNRGMIVTDKEEMISRATQASANGISIAIHAIGDRANRDVLDVFSIVRNQEEAQLAGKISRPADNLRHRIEHAQIVHPDDFQRFKKLDIIASMQPIHATSDMDMADAHWGDRTRYSYAWKTFLKYGVALLFGSDAPVESIDPLTGILAAATRQKSDGYPGLNGWHPEQRLDMVDILGAYTSAPAFASGQEQHLGAISPGKLADMTVFDRDILAVSREELSQAVVEGTMVGGRFMFRSW